MLFALLDYYRYRSQRGIYSTSYIRGRNGHLLTRENFPDPTAFKPGSVFFIHRRISLTSWLIMYLTSSPWNHTGMFTGDGTVIEALTDGTIERPFSDYLDGRSYMSAYTPPYLDVDGPTNAVAHARSAIGAPYNWLGVLRLGAKILLGRHAHYRLRLSIDVLIVLGILSLPALRWKPWIFATSTLTIPYLATVVYSRPIRKEVGERMQKSATSRA